MPSKVLSQMAKKLLIDSMKELMAVKPLDKISVREIVENAGMSRHTFYYHFDDIYDAVKYMYEQEFRTLFSGSELDLTWQKQMGNVLNYLMNNRDVCMCVLDSKYNEEVRHFFYSSIKDIIKNYTNLIAHDLDVDSAYKEMLSHFITISLSALMESWFRGQIDKTPEELIAFIDISLYDQVRINLERSMEKPQNKLQSCV